MKALFPDFTAFANRVAIFDGRVGNENIVTYRRLESAIEVYREEFKSRGLKRGDRLCLLSENRFEWAAVFYACLAEGFVLVPLDLKGIPSDWLKIVEDCQPKILVASSLGQSEIQNANGKATALHDLLHSLEAKNFDRNLKLSELAESHPEDTAVLIYT